MGCRPQAFPFVARPLPKTENQTLAEHSRHAVRTMSCLWAILMAVDTRDGPRPNTG